MIATYISSDSAFVRTVFLQQFLQTLVDTCV